MTTAFMRVGEQREFKPPTKFRGYHHKTPMPAHYKEAAVVYSKDFMDYAEKDLALVECEGAVYQVETVHRIKRIK